MQILIIDKDKSFAFRVKSILHDLGFEQVTVCHSTDAAMANLKASSYDLVLMDFLENNGSNGLFMMHYINENIHIPIVFLASQENQELIDEVMKLNPAGLLVKPFMPINLYATINLALQRHQKKSILIKDSNRVLLFSIPEFLYVQCKGNYVEIVTENKRYKVRQTMQKIEDLLDSDVFVRIHRSFIVNSRHVCEVKRGYLLLNSEKLPISRSMQENAYNYINNSVCKNLTHPLKEKKH